MRLGPRVASIHLVQINATCDQNSRPKSHFPVASRLCTIYTPRITEARAITPFHTENRKPRRDRSGWGAGSPLARSRGEGHLQAGALLARYKCRVQTYGINTVGASALLSSYQGTLFFLKIFKSKTGVLVCNATRVCVAFPVTTAHGRGGSRDSLTAWAHWGTWTEAVPGGNHPAS